MNAYEFGAFMKRAIDADLDTGYDRAGIAAKIQHARQLGQQAQQNGGQLSLRGNPAMATRFNNMSASAGGMGRAGVTAPPVPAAQPRPVTQKSPAAPMIQTRRESPDL